jgi:hypothetical protein
MQSRVSPDGFGNNAGPHAEGAVLVGHVCLMGNTCTKNNGVR